MCLSGRVRPAIGAIQRVGPNCAPRCALESLKSRSVRPSKRLKPPSRYQWRVKGLKSLQRREGATRGNRPCKRSGGSVSRRPTRGVAPRVSRRVSRAVSRCRGARCAHTLPRRTDKPGRAKCVQICCRSGGWVSHFCGKVPSVFRAGLHGPNPRREAAGEQHTICTLSVNRVVGTKWYR